MWSNILINSVMVLVSHKHKFIYLKTRKTAGTSVEVFFEPFCRPSKEQKIETDTIISEIGIVGKRGPSSIEKEGWTGHIPAYLVQEKLGQSIWDSYFKFCVIRNPWDRMVSAYWFKNRKKKTIPDFKPWLLDWYFGSFPKTNLPDWIKSFPYQTSYKTWLKNSPFVPQEPNTGERNIYTIDNKLALDYYIRFENLSGGIEEVCQKLSLPCDLERLGNHNSSSRKNKRHYTEYYDQETTEIVSKAFAQDIKDFSYRFGD